MSAIISLGIGPLAVSEIADAIWDEARAGHVAAGSYGAVSEWASAGGLTAQQTRDAMKLAPTTGAPAAGSVDAHLDSLIAGQSTGTYSYSNTVTGGSGNLLDGVFVECATDSGFTNIVNTTHTNVLGAFTVYSDVAGTHYLRLQLSGYTFAIQTVTLA